MNTFTVKTQQFEGPLELLLELIEKRKLHINDISLAAVTDDFVRTMNQMSELPLSQSAHFIWTASTLLLIKSRSLLPHLTLTEEEEGDVENLELRLKLYQYYKSVSPLVSQCFGKGILYAPLAGGRREPVFTPDRNCNIPTLYSHARAVLANLPKKEAMREAVVEQVVSLEEMIEQLSERITKNLALSFKDFTGRRKQNESREERLTVIVGFLAVLELVKRGILDVTQEERFSDITMQTERVGIPRYE